MLCYKIKWIIQNSTQLANRDKQVFIMWMVFEETHSGLADVLSSETILTWKHKTKKNKKIITRQGLKAYGSKM